MTRTRNVTLLSVGMALALGASHSVMAQGQQTVAAQIIQPDQEDEFLKGTVLHPELDREAIDTLKAWQFEPARLYLEPVRVVVEVHMAFQLG